MKKEEQKPAQPVRPGVFSRGFMSDELKRLVRGEWHDPFVCLGAHPVAGERGPATVIRALLPGARSMKVLDIVSDQEVSAELIDQQGLFEALIPGQRDIYPYRLKVDFGHGVSVLFYDCYAFLPVLADVDLYLIGEGKHYNIYDKLGAHGITHQGIFGTLFAVWAPSAVRVSVVGEFNQWNGLRHQMRSRGTSGVWELFVPHLGPGLLYKYEIRTANGTLLLKSDPFAFLLEKRPGTASVTHDPGDFVWNDDEWIRAREKEDPLARPMAIYEVHLGSWRRKGDDKSSWLTYREAAEELVSYVKDMGFNYIEFLPLTEHPFDASWGYQVTGFYAPTSRYGTPEDLMYLVDRCHGEGIGVILDWVPGHFPRDAHGLEYFDGTHLYEHADPRQGVHKEWDTLVFNYGRNEVRNFLIANALFWLDKYHFDGLRVDAVASILYLDYSREEGEWIPNRFGGRENLEGIQFLKEFNQKVYEKFPGVVTIAEESTAWPGVSRPVYLGGLGFMFKWNMGWMHDMLTFMSKDPIHRRYHMDYLTFALLYAFHENFILPLSHDEVVHGKASLLSKMPGDDWQKTANLRLLLGYMYGEPGKKMLFMGGEFGQWSEWNHDEGLDWSLLEYGPHRQLQQFVRDLNRTYLSEPALFEQDFQPEGFEWIDFRDTDSMIVSFIRRGKSQEQPLVFVFNFTPVPRLGYRIGAPRPGFYRELINSDAAVYGGSNIGLEGGIPAEPIPWHGQPYSLNLRLPPLSMLILKPAAE
ncbi:MAG: 1,4-alpha-glucan branching protein GlgB [Thermodesulfobacteriota bacterium]|nr:1,4-alpha-glucan branching protein GlgB [Thermodesulfobacteriota bacterium]